MIPATTPPATAIGTALRRAPLRRALAAVIVTLWLGWTLPVLFALNRPAAPVLGEADIHALAQRLGLPDGPALVIAAGGCRCAGTAAATLASAAGDAGVHVLAAGAGMALPYPVLAFDAGHRLVYAGSAQLPRNCLGGATSAWPLVSQLLKDRPDAAFYAAPCTC